MPERSALFLGRRVAGKYYRVGASLPSVAPDQLWPMVIWCVEWQLNRWRFAAPARVSGAAKPSAKLLPQVEDSVTLGQDGGVARIDREGLDENDPANVSWNGIRKTGHVDGKRLTGWNQPRRNAREFEAAGLRLGMW